MSRLILLLLFAAFAAAQIDDGCINCGLPDHPNCQVNLSDSINASSTFGPIYYYMGYFSSGVSAQQLAGGAVLLLHNSRLEQETW